MEGDKKHGLRENKQWRRKKKTRGRGPKRNETVEEL